MPSRKVLIVVSSVGLAVLAAGAFVVNKARHVNTASDPAESSEPVHRVGQPLETSDAVETIYDGKLNSGWSDWGWGPHDLPMHGPAAITFSGYGGILLQHAAVQKPISGVSFRFKAPLAWGDFLVVSLKLSGSPDSLFKPVRVEMGHVALLPDGVQEALIPWAELNPKNAPFDRLMIAARKPVPSEPVLLDKILLLRGHAAAQSSSPSRSTELAVLCTSEARPISPLIYGSTGGDFSSSQTIERLGGNPATRLNWDLHVWNSGQDWFFENGKGVDIGEWLQMQTQNHVLAAVTVPTIGWVSKDLSSVAFPKAKFPSQQKFDPYRSEAGNGLLADGKPITGNAPELTSIAATPEMIARWVQSLREKDQAHGSRVIQSYILDNEPSLWNTTHRDVHPKPLTYDELMDRTIRYATAIRGADPEVKIAGPAEWGWMGYFYSAKDREEGKFLRSDRRAHDDQPLVPWYLKQLAQYEKEHGTRLLDVLDLHFYPAADGLYGPNARTDPEASELRLRSTRALWDPSYVDETWINEPVRLIPRMKEWVAENYPGLGLSIGEWSFGADAHISGALATAEALGRFGQQGLTSAYYWQGPAKNTGTFWAFRAFRNYDGAGARFLDFSLPTRESGKVSLFASRDASGQHVVAVLVNRDPVFATDASVDLGSCGDVKIRRLFTYDATASGLTARSMSDSFQTSRVVVPLPPYSIAVLEVALTPNEPP